MKEWEKEEVKEREEGEEEEWEKREKEETVFYSPLGTVRAHAPRNPNTRTRNSQLPVTLV